ncbi:MAG TPA: DNRLRE domain-containing protein, partial [Thermomicrobiaceae bacterium]|nr:DNRLRE domain-containing protein [Thermomicrobiaceae bacterium]
AVNPGSWYAWDVTAAVSANGTLTLAVTSGDSDGAFYASREAGASMAPQLVVTVDTATATPTPTPTPTATATATATPTPTATATPTPTPTPTATATATTTPTPTPTATPTATATATATPTPTPTPTATATPTPTPTPTGTPTGPQTLTFTPTADTYVDSGSPTTNFGTSADLVVGGNSSNVGIGGGTIRDTYLKFDLSGLSGTVTSATLRLFCATDATNISWASSSTGGSVAAVSDSSWSETAMTYDTRPTIDGPVLSSVGAVNPGSWYAWDVTAAVSANGTLTLAVTSGDSDGAFYASREAGASMAPQLVVTVATATATPTPTPSPTATPTPTPTPSASDPVVAAAGDIACDPTSSSYKNGNGTKSACQQMATSNLLVNGNYAAIFDLGDNQYDDATLAKFQQVYGPSWGRVLGTTHPAAGNHEYASGSATGYFDYFGAAAGNPSQGYYSLNIGTWHIVILNSNCSEVGGCGPGSPQEQWLAQDLAANTSACTMAVWHQPRFSSGVVGNNVAYDAFWQDLYAAHADIVLDGHDHDYERFAPQNPSAQADPANGIREFVVGTGGVGFVSFKTIQPNSQVRNNNTFGILALTLHANGYDWKFLPIAGSTFTDSGTGTCHR